MIDIHETFDRAVHVQPAVVAMATDPDPPAAPIWTVESDSVNAHAGFGATGDSVQAAHTATGSMTTRTERNRTVFATSRPRYGYTPGRHYTMHCVPHGPVTWACQAAVRPCERAEVLGAVVAWTGRSRIVTSKSVHEEAGHRWIQLGLEHEPMHMLTVHIGGADGLQRGATSVGAWVADSIRNGAFANVA